MGHCQIKIILLLCTHARKCTDTIQPCNRRHAPYYRIKESYRDVQGHVKEHLDGLTLIEQAKADEWWSRMEKEGGIDRFNKQEQNSLRKYEN